MSNFNLNTNLLTLSCDGIPLTIAYTHQENVSIKYDIGTVRILNQQSHKLRRLAYLNNKSNKKYIKCSNSYIKNIDFSLFTEIQLIGMGFQKLTMVSNLTSITEKVLMFPWWSPLFRKDESKILTLKFGTKEEFGLTISGIRNSKIDKILELCTM